MPYVDTHGIAAVVQNERIARALLDHAAVCMVGVPEHVRHFDLLQCGFHAVGKIRERYVFDGIKHLVVHIHAEVQARFVEGERRHVEGGGKRRQRLRDGQVRDPVRADIYGVLCEKFLCQFPFDLVVTVMRVIKLLAFLVFGDQKSAVFSVNGVAVALFDRHEHVIVARFCVQGHVFVFGADHPFGALARRIGVQSRVRRVGRGRLIKELIRLKEQRSVLVQHEIARFVQRRIGILRVSGVYDAVGTVNGHADLSVIRYFCTRQRPYCIGGKRICRQIFERMRIICVRLQGGKIFVDLPVLRAVDARVDPDLLSLRASCDIGDAGKVESEIFRKRVERGGNGEQFFKIVPDIAERGRVQSVAVDGHISERIHFVDHRVHFFVEIGGNVRKFLQRDVPAEGGLQIFYEVRNGVFGIFGREQVFLPDQGKDLFDLDVFIGVVKAAPDRQREHERPDQYGYDDEQQFAAETEIGFDHVLPQSAEIS